MKSKSTAGTSQLTSKIAIPLDAATQAELSAAAGRDGFPTRQAAVRFALSCYGGTTNRPATFRS
jgi:uncharacterized metal-binding protein